MSMDSEAAGATADEVVQDFTTQLSVLNSAGMLNEEQVASAGAAVKQGQEFVTTLGDHAEELGQTVDFLAKLYAAIKAAYSAYKEGGDVGEAFVKKINDAAKAFSVEYAAVSNVNAMDPEGLMSCASASAQSGNVDNRMAELAANKLVKTMTVEQRAEITAETPYLVAAKEERVAKELLEQQAREARKGKGTHAAKLQAKRKVVASSERGGRA